MEVSTTKITGRGDIATGDAASITTLVTGSIHAPIGSIVRIRRSTITNSITGDTREPVTASCADTLNVNLGIIWPDAVRGFVKESNLQTAPVTTGIGYPPREGTEATASTTGATAGTAGTTT